MELPYSGDVARFQTERFVVPEATFWPLYLWMWNDEVTDERITQQLDMIQAQGAQSVWVLPVPEEHRPESNPTHLKPTYLSDEWMQVMRSLFQELSARGMYAWLYDEGGWPSGSVCGRVVREHPELASQWLERQEIRPVYEDVFTAPADCLAAFAFQGDQILTRLTPGVEQSIVGRGGKYWPTDDVRVEVYWVRRQQVRNYYYPPYPDMLNPRSIQSFIELTHQRYESAVGEFFGSVVPVIVSDEMSFGHNPVWTDDLTAAFKQEKGYDLLDKLPAIFSGDTREDQQVRIDFHDWCTQRFADSCATIQDWCHKHGLLYSGHLGPEDETLAPYLYGRNLMRVLRRHDIPGTDTIFRQIFPYPKGAVGVEEAASKAGVNELKHLNHYFPKYTSSVAHQEGYRRCFTESFAVYGSGVTLQQMKWVMNFQYVRGMNLYIFSAVYLSNEDHYMGSNTRPVADDRNPLMRYVRGFNEYMARLSYVTSIGTPGIDTAVYYPGRDFFAGVAGMQLVQATHEGIVKALLEGQCDFDLIDEDALESAVVENGCLVVGPMRYRTIYVGHCHWLGESSRKKLDAVAATGGKFFWVDPDHLTKLPKLIEPQIDVIPNDPWIRVCRRDIDEGSLYLITNEDPEDDKRCTLGFKEGRAPIELNLETGTLSRPRTAAQTDVGWTISVDLPVAGARAYLFADAIADLESADPETGAPVKIIDVHDRISLRKVRSYQLGEREIQVVDLVDSPPVLAELGDWATAIGAEFSGEAEYLIEFDCTVGEVERAQFLDLGEVNAIAEVWLNSVPLGRRLWRPFVFATGDALMPGRNEMRVMVINTLANQFASNTEVFQKWPPEIFTTYYARNLYFERQSTASGLTGPLRLLSVR